MVLKGIVLKRLGTGRAQYFFPSGEERKKVHVAHLITLAQLICSTGVAYEKYEKEICQKARSAESAEFVGAAIRMKASIDDEYT
jgi:hypothetical protein